MNLKSIALGLAGLAIIVACNSTKKSTTSTAVAPATPTTPSTPAVASKPSNGVYAPGNDELVAIQTKFPDATLDKLKEGYALYAQGPCTNCHGTKNIYAGSDVHWKPVIDNMAEKARLTESQKDAVYKYVMAIRTAKTN